MVFYDETARNPLTSVYRCVYTVLVGYIHYSRFRDTGTPGPRKQTERCKLARIDQAAASHRNESRKPHHDRTMPRKRAPRERGPLDIIIANGSSEPIYEQIARQIKGAIMAGELAEGDPLPSIRALANDLRISVITTKRAYAELEEAGFIDTVQGKGSFVAGGNLELLREERLRQVEAHLARAVAEATAAGIGPADLHAMLDLLLEED